MSETKPGTNAPNPVTEKTDSDAQSRSPSELVPNPMERLDQIISAVESLNESPAGTSEDEPELVDQTKKIEAIADASKPSARVGSEAPGDDSTEDETETKKKPPGLGPRWSYIITRGLVVALVWAFFAFAFDPLLRFGAVTAAQQAVGAKVDVGSFRTQLFPPKIVAGNVAVANASKPGTNLIEFAHLEGEVSGLALLKKSYIIEKATVTGLTWGTERSDSGLLDDSETKEVEEEDGSDAVQKKIEEMGRKWADDLLARAKLEYDPNNLETYRLATQLEEEWKTDFDDMESRVQNVEQRIRQIKAEIEASKRDPVRQAQAYRKALEEAPRLAREARRFHEDLKQVIPKARQDAASLNEARKRDVAEVERKVKELVLDGDKLSEFLLGPELNHRVHQALSWIRWTTERVDEFSGDGTQPRHRGDEIVFHDRNPLPKYLVRLIDVTGRGEIAGDVLALEGTIADVTTDPKLHGKPVVARMQAHGEAEVSLLATIDRTGDQAINRLELSYELPNGQSTMLGKEESIAVEVAAEKSRWHVNLNTEDEVLTGRILLTQKPVRLQAHVTEKADERLRNVIAASVQNVDEIVATVRLSGTVRKPKWKIETNLGRQISRGVQNGINQQITAEKDQLVARLNEKLTERNNEFINMFNTRYGGVNSLLDELDEHINGLTPKIGNRAFDPGKLFRQVGGQRE